MRLTYSVITGSVVTVGLVNSADRRPVSLAGLGLIGAGAVLGLALSAPAAAAGPTDSARVASTDSAPVVPPDQPER